MIYIISACHWCKRVRGLKSLNDRLNLAHLLGLIGVHTKDKLGGQGGGLIVGTTKSN